MSPFVASFTVQYRQDEPGGSLDKSGRSLIRPINSRSASS
jgi:hypothetical protein